ncbi:hypothetical protein DENSPDRAFT_283467 [Dentipellis sp. KUC8613]|nr:hypothetical protein DENSPDRAFT_283467 [Dentipellis sp. KUC8613]
MHSRKYKLCTLFGISFERRRRQRHASRSRTRGGTLDVDPHARAHVIIREPTGAGAARIPRPDDLRVFAKAERRGTVKLGWCAAICGGEGRGRERRFRVPRKRLWRQASAGGRADRVGAGDLPGRMGFDYGQEAAVGSGRCAGESLEVKRLGSKQGEGVEADVCTCCLTRPG